MKPKHKNRYTLAHDDARAVGVAGVMRIRKMLAKDKELATAYRTTLRILGDKSA